MLSQIFQSDHVLSSDHFKLSFDATFPSLPIGYQSFSLRDHVGHQSSFYDVPEYPREESIDDVQKFMDVEDDIGYLKKTGKNTWQATANLAKINDNSVIFGAVESSSQSESGLQSDVTTVTSGSTTAGSKSVAKVESPIEEELTPHARDDLMRRWLSKEQKCSKSASNGGTGASDTVSLVGKETQHQVDVHVSAFPQRQKLRTEESSYQELVKKHTACGTGYKCVSRIDAFGIKRGKHDLPNVLEHRVDPNHDIYLKRVGGGPQEYAAGCPSIGMEEMRMCKSIKGERVPASECGLCYTFSEERMNDFLCAPGSADRDTDQHPLCMCVLENNAGDKDAGGMQAYDGRSAEQPLKGTDKELSASVMASFKYYHEVKPDNPDVELPRRPFTFGESTPFAAWVEIAKLKGQGEKLSTLTDGYMQKWAREITLAMETIGLSLASTLAKCAAGDQVEKVELKHAVQELHDFSMMFSQCKEHALDLHRASSGMDKEADIDDVVSRCYDGLNEYFYKNYREDTMFAAIGGQLEACYAKSGGADRNSKTWFEGDALLKAF